MRYKIVKTPEGAYTMDQLSQMKASELPDEVLVYVDPKTPYKPEKRVKPKRPEMVTTWQFDRLTEEQKKLVQELYKGKYIKEIMNIFAEAKVYPDTVCDTCFESLKTLTIQNVKSAIEKKIL